MVSTSRLLCLALLVSAPSNAMPWKVDTNASQLKFDGVQTDNPFSGTFERYSVDINYDPSNPKAANLTVKIDLSSAKTGDPQRDTALPQPDWFDVSSFAAATFTTEGFEPIGQDQFQTTGILSLKGVERELTLTFTLNTTDKKAVAKGSFSLNRSEFGVGVGPWAEGKWVALDVGVHFEITAHPDTESGT